jgi:hypothetical protein
MNGDVDAQVSEGHGGGERARGADAFPPAGFVDRDGACALFGVSSRTWLTWQRDGRVTCGRLQPRPGDGHVVKLYPVAELERLRAELGQVGQPYPDPDRPGVWRVPLRGRLERREVLVDEQDLPGVRGRKWNWQERGDGTGGIVILARPQKPLHRMILGLTDPAARVSFANGDPLDCTRANLRVRTQAEVAHASRPARARGGKACGSAFKGVAFDGKCGTWRAAIRRDDLNATIGYFGDAAAAAEAYDDCARVWFGDGAYLNFPHRPSTDEGRARGQAVLGKAVARRRRRGRRVKRLARLLKRDARAADQQALAKTGSEPADTPVIGRHQARRLLGVPRATWARWAKRGWLAFGRRAGGRTVYPVARIKRLLEACGRLRAPRPDPERPDVWRVPLFGRGRRGPAVLVDASSLPLIESGWCAINGARAETEADAYVAVWSPATKDRRPLRRLVAGVADEGLEVYHHNGDPLDCRRANLVVATPAQRTYRKRKIAFVNGKPTTSQYKGVSWGRGKWVAMIHCGGTARYLGRHAREEDAAIAYDRAARELFGEHARLNFPDATEALLAAEAEDMAEPARWRRTGLGLVA